MFRMGLKLCRVGFAGRIEMRSVARDLFLEK